jgi:hypothetical protein
MPTQWKLQLADDRLRKLEEEILKTGFPLELEVDDILTERGFLTSPSSPFIDEVTMVEREVDNYALFPDPPSQMEFLEPLGVSPHVTVECKKLVKMAAVIFPRKRPVITRFDLEGQMYDFPYLIDHRPRTTNPSLNFEMGWTISRSGIHYDDFAPRIGLAKGVRFRGNEEDNDEQKGKDLVFDGLMKLVKAQSHDVRISIARDKTIASKYYPFYFSFLALVIDGDLVEFEIENGKPSLKPVNHAVARLSLKPSYSDEFLGYLVDVVRHDYFKQYLTLLEQDFEKLKKALLVKRDEVVGYLQRPIRPRSVF